MKGPGLSRPECSSHMIRPCLRHSKSLMVCCTAVILWDIAFKCFEPVHLSYACQKGSPSKGAWTERAKCWAQPPLPLQAAQLAPVPPSARSQAVGGSTCSTAPPGQGQPCGSSPCGPRKHT